MNAKIAPLAAALVLTAAAAGAQTLPSPFETMGAYDVPVQWASKDCQHVPCELASEPGKTAKTAPLAPSISAAAKADDAPLYNASNGNQEGTDIAKLMAAMNSSDETAPRPRAAGAEGPAEVPNAATVVHVGGEQARIDSGVFTFRKTQEAAELLKEERININTPGNGFAVPGQTIDPNKGTADFTGRPTRAVSNTEE